MRTCITGIEKEAHLSSYSDSSEKGTEVHNGLCCLEGRIGMYFDTVQEGYSLWFLEVKGP